MLTVERPGSMMPGMAVLVAVGVRVMVGVLEAVGELVAVGEAVAVFVFVGVGLGPGDGVKVSVGVLVTVGVCVSVGVSLAVAVALAVLVADAVFVAVGVLVDVSVEVAVAVLVAVSVAVGVAVSVGVLVGVSVAVAVGVSVAVAVGVSVGVGVAVDATALTVRSEVESPLEPPVAALKRIVAPAEETTLTVIVAVPFGEVVTASPLLGLKVTDVTEPVCTVWVKVTVTPIAGVGPASSVTSTVIVASATPSPSMVPGVIVQLEKENGAAFTRCVGLSASPALKARAITRTMAAQTRSF
jgi:hypothetical protein